MASSSAGGMTRSAVPMTAQEGTAFQATGPDGGPAARAPSGRWVADSTAASRADRPLAKQPGNLPGSRDRSGAGAAAPGAGTASKTPVGFPIQDPGRAARRSPMDSPGAGMNASTYTSALTSLSPTAASEMTAPPQECPTSTTGLP